MARATTILGVVSLFVTALAAAEPVEAGRALVERILPDHADSFRLEEIPKEDGKDVFEIETVDGTVVLRGSTGVALASALNWYLNQYCHATFSLCGSQLEIPDPLPEVAPKVRHVTPLTYRYCFNYCCFSYSMAWYDWDDWERVIDWMALHGVNMPLAVTGQESTWRAVCRDLGLTDDEIAAFLVGPAYLPFGWMGCMDGWGGPLPASWIDRHEALQKRILQRERELGMTPVLQGFTGHVPAALEAKFPSATFRELPSWCGFPGTKFIDPQDPLFKRIGQAFVEEQTRQFGTDHLYASDTFIEMSPPSSDPAFLTGMAQAVYGAMEAADPEAVWVMQGWLFVNNPGFWKPPQAKALLSALPKGRMIVLDLWCESRPAWGLTESFYGNPWVWCVIQSFGNQVSLHGGLSQMAAGLPEALASPDRGDLVGSGFIMEGLGYNQVIYDFLSDLTWQPRQPELSEWVDAYTHRRYGRKTPEAEQAWRVLLSTAYQRPGHITSAITRRPSIGVGGPLYLPSRLGEAAQLLLECADDLEGVDTYRYDLVHVTRQVLADLASAAARDMVLAFRHKDREQFTESADRLTDLMTDLDELLGTRPEFLLGRWLEDAKRWAVTDEDRRLYEWNARNQITLWGPADSVLHDYAAKQWSGLMGGFYAPRWRQFIERTGAALEAGEPFDQEAFDRDMQVWEEKWTHGTELYASEPQGDEIEVVRRLWAKHHDAVFKVEAPSLTTGKPVQCSAALDAYPARLGNDGMRSSTDSYWATDVNTDPDCWWQVDLEKRTEVGRVVVVLYFGDKRTYEFTVETSKNGKDWDCVADYRGNPRPSTRHGVTCRFKSRKARYIRVTVTGNSANTGRHLVEVMAFEE